MNKKTHLTFFVLALSVFSLCACNQEGTSKKISYDNREFDISLNNDGSLICKSVKEGNNYSLTISGSGSAKEYDRKEAVPWNPIVKKVNQVTINEGINNIGDYFFNSLTLDYYLLPKTVTKVGNHSFNKNATIYTFGSEINNIENDIYYYSESEPTTKGKYFFIENDKPCIWPDIPEEPVSFLFVGNSFTYRGTAAGTVDNPEVPRDFKAIADNLNIPVNVDSVVKGSHTLTRFADSSDEMGSILEQKLTTNQYDYVILQEQSTTPINNYNTFLAAIKKINTRVGQTQNKAKVVLYETWGTPSNTQSDPSSYGKTPGEMEAKIRTAYTNAGEDTGLQVNYIGKAFTYAYETQKINIYADDNRHQNGLGAYLSAACHIRSFFKINVSKCTEYCGLDSNECKALLSVADTVI